MLLARKGLGIYGSSPTKQYVMVNSLPAPVGAATMFANTVGVRNGMYVSTQLLTSPDNYTYTLSPNGVPLYLAGGNMARQFVAENIWDPFTREWGTQITDYVNNKAPTPTDQPNGYTVSYIINQVAATLDMRIYANDVESDIYTITQLSGVLPTGLSFASPNITGTPTVSTGTSPLPVAYRYDDGHGGILDLSFLFSVAELAVQVPNVVGLTQLTARNILNAAGFTVTSNAPGDSLIVKSQTPAAGSTATTPSNVFLDTLPSGGGGSGGGASQHRNVGGLR